MNYIFREGVYSGNVKHVEKSWNFTHFPLESCKICAFIHHLEIKLQFLNYCISTKCRTCSILEDLGI